MPPRVDGRHARRIATLGSSAAFAVGTKFSVPKRTNIVTAPTFTDIEAPASEARQWPGVDTVKSTSVSRYGSTVTSCVIASFSSGVRSC
jgi:hypothetical protein